jgi:hypothetical protein
MSRNSETQHLTISQSTARSGRLRCNAWAHSFEADNQIAAPDRTDLNLHRFQMGIIKSAHGSLAEARHFSYLIRQVLLDRSKLLMEAVADRPPFRFATLRLLNGITVR